jgi:uncharacterized protein with LGFP repeats
MGLSDGRGRARDYENSSIYFTPQTGAHEFHGGNRLKWAQLRGHRGFLGYPITDETGTVMAGSTILSMARWAQQSGAFEVHGAIRDPLGKYGFRTLEAWLSGERRNEHAGRTAQPLRGRRDQVTPPGGPKASFGGGFGDDVAMQLAHHKPLQATGLHQHSHAATSGADSCLPHACTAY